MGSKLVFVHYSTITSMLTIAIVSYTSLLSHHTASSLPLSTSSQWIVDSSSGSRVKLSCVNWASHLTPMLAEGLHLHALQSIAHTIAHTWGFNCVRLSWATTMFTNKTLAEARVFHTFRELGLDKQLEGVASFNGKLVGMTSVEAFKEVVRVLSKEGVMVVLDNRVGDEDASSIDEIWVQGLQTVASLFKGWPSVVGITLRSGINLSPEDWFRHMKKGADAIGSQNSDLLLIYQGLRNEEGLQYLLERSLSKESKQKIVYEVQNYMKQGVSNNPCKAVMQETWTTIGIANAFPLLVGEFGWDQAGPSASKQDACSAPCFTNFAAHSSMDLAVWIIQGSYYLRQGAQDDDEICGLFNHQWSAPRNDALLQNVQARHIRFLQDEERPHKVLFHPPAGLCVNKVNVNGLQMGSCNQPSSWKLSPQGLLILDGTYLVIGAQGPNRPAVLDLQGTEANGPWTFSTNAHFTQVSTTLNGQTLCLDSSSPPTVLTNPCTCLDISSSSMNQQQCKDAQWFTFDSSSH